MTTKNELNLIESIRNLDTEKFSQALEHCDQDRDIDYNNTKFHEEIIKQISSSEKAIEKAIKLKSMLNELLQRGLDPFLDVDSNNIAKAIVRFLPDDIYRKIYSNIYNDTFELILNKYSNFATEDQLVDILQIAVWLNKEGIAYSLLLEKLKTGNMDFSREKDLLNRYLFLLSTQLHKVKSFNLTIKMLSDINNSPSKEEIKILNKSAHEAFKRSINAGNIEAVKLLIKYKYTNFDLETNDNNEINAHDLIKLAANKVVLESNLDQKKIYSTIFFAICDAYMEKGLEFPDNENVIKLLGPEFGLDLYLKNNFNNLSGNDNYFRDIDTIIRSYTRETINDSTEKAKYVNDQMKEKINNYYKIKM